MLKKIYVNNYRCLVAFEIRFDEMNVFCGVNGTGKSSVFDALRFVRDLATGNCFLGSAGDESKRTISKLEFCKWLDSTTQEFELEIEENECKFIYQLHIEQVAEYEQPRIIKEVARCDGVDLFTRDLNHIRYGDNKGFSLDWRQSALFVFQPSNSQRKIKELQQSLSSLIILRPNVGMFENESKFELKYPSIDLSNVISWYRHFAQDQDWTDVLRASLQMIWPDDFKSLKLSELGASIKQLELNFSGELLRFGQLSDGEKMLVALYIVHAVLSTTKNSLTVLIDEPDNFISIQELQPWMLEICEIADEMRQVILISHNSDILENSPSQIQYFYRDNHSSPTRIKPLEIQKGLTIREALARGWVYD